MMWGLCWGRLGVGGGAAAATGPPNNDGPDQLKIGPATPALPLPIQPESGVSRLSGFSVGPRRSTGANSTPPLGPLGLTQIEAQLPPIEMLLRTQRQWQPLGIRSSFHYPLVLVDKGNSHVQSARQHSATASRKHKEKC